MSFLHDPGIALLGLDHEYVREPGALKHLEEIEDLEASKGFVMHERQITRSEPRFDRRVAADSHVDSTAYPTLRTDRALENVGTSPKNWLPTSGRPDHQQGVNRQADHIFQGILGRIVRRHANRGFAVEIRERIDGGLVGPAGRSILELFTGAQGDGAERVGRNRYTFHRPQCKDGRQTPANNRLQGPAGSSMAGGKSLATYISWNVRRGRAIRCVPLQKYADRALLPAL